MKRHKREFQTALREMTEAAMTLADVMIALAPQQPTADELTKVETFIADHIVAETKATLISTGAGPIALGFVDGPGVEAFRQLFGARFRAQAHLKASDVLGVA